MQKRTLYPQGSDYKGSLHMHSTHSDGIQSPQQLADAYRAQGYAFIALTDHGLYKEHPELDAEGFITLGGVELDITHTGPRAYTHHVVGICPRGQGPADNTRFTDRPAWTQSPQTAQALADQLRAYNMYTLYAHPAWSRVRPQDIDGLQCDGLEILNFGCKTIGVGYANEFYECMLMGGHRLHALAVDDTHHAPNNGGGWVMVRASELSGPAIVQALRDGSFYSSEGPVLHDFYVQEGIAYVSCAPCSRITFITDPIGQSRDLGNPAYPLRGGEYKLPEAASYVRAVLTDAHGLQAWSNPIWL